MCKLWWTDIFCWCNFVKSWLDNALKNAGAYDKQVIKDIIIAGSPKPWVDKMTITAFSIVKESFDTGGYGKWKQSIMKFKKTKQTLVETQQLRNAITWDVK